MARTSYLHQQILASIALATAVIAFIFLVVDSTTAGVENTRQYDVSRELATAQAK